ncbi:uncharacterized protein LOC123879366 [Maniola jurtina]|uniref:uncharacterized protein LOC123879366 n=1 Tax=Maniola jurtina TaxID=191418 RepID=UPI001E68E3A4|nr:uncharacterized protein LOC123879366 [Maniola jurtina]
MFKNKYNLYHIYILLSLPIAQCRKYDIEQECLTLYGESLKSVLDRFRRTPEYLNILNDEVTELHKQLEAVLDRIAYVYTLKLYDRVVHEMGAHNNQTHVYRSRPLKGLNRPRISKRGRYKQSPVNMLDSYDYFKNPLTLAEKNRMKQLGFEYIGLAIHAMLENMSPDGALPESTRMPDGHQIETTHHNHEFTQPSTESESTHGHHLLRNIGRTGVQESPYNTTKP